MFGEVSFVVVVFVNVGDKRLLVFREICKGVSFVFLLMGVFFFLVSGVTMWEGFY